MAGFDEEHFGPVVVITPDPNAIKCIIKNGNAIESNSSRFRSSKSCQELYFNAICSFLLYLDPCLVITLPVNTGKPLSDKCEI